MWMNAALTYMLVIIMLNVPILLGASLADVMLDTKEMDILVKVCSRQSKCLFNDHTSIVCHAVVDAVLIGSIVGSGLVIGVVLVTVAICICYVLYHHSHVTKIKHYR